MTIQIELDPWEYEHALNIGARRYVANWGKRDATHYDKNRMEDNRTAQAAACVSRADRAEAKLEELRCQHDRLLASLKPAQAGDTPLPIKAGRKRACEVPAPAIDMSRYDYQD